VVNFVFPNGETDSVAKAEKGKERACRQNRRPRLKKQKRAGPAGAAACRSGKDSSRQKSAVEEARSAEADAKAEADKAEKE